MCVYDLNYGILCCIYADAKLYTSLKGTKKHTQSLHRGQSRRPECMNYICIYAYIHACMHACIGI